ncbi:hypothetical protein CDO52_22850 [Nocardiopsis gilva YIM 90087]|uniref:DUF222 domain-containing protein n=1 Tax=Nocardiopsis gilva YIM 90087 TaxID=1235441 RepID=A0A223SAX5_9ACTN|nr:hypothetical protein CDO52_22850 [Nocardiopsis gilva YIM 90087]
MLGEVAGADIPPGAEHTVGEDLIQVLQGLDEVKLAAADAAGVFEARGGLVGSGQFRLSHWLQHTAHRSPAEARQLASLAHRSAHLEESEQAYQQGEISLAKLERIAHWVNEGLACRSVQRWPEAEAFAHTAEGPLLGLACEPGVTVWGLDQVGRRLRYTLDPARQEKEYQDRYAGRGARFIRGMDDSFHLEAWGDEASGDVLRNALDAFLAPPATEGEERSSYQRTHDALVEMCQTVVELPAEQAPRRRAGANPVALVVGLDLLQGQEGRVRRSVSTAPCGRPRRPGRTLRMVCCGGWCVIRSAGSRWMWVMPSGCSPRRCAPLCWCSARGVRGRAGVTGRSRGARPTTRSPGGTAAPRTWPTPSRCAGSTTWRRSTAGRGSAAGPSGPAHGTGPTPRRRGRRAVPSSPAARTALTGVRARRLRTPAGVRAPLIGHRMTPFDAACSCDLAGPARSPRPAGHRHAVNTRTW